jgi:hypothetical protein
MNIVLQSASRLLVSFTADELVGICNALNEVCHGVHIEDPEFQTRLGVSRSFLADLLGQLHAGANHPALHTESRVGVWADSGSVQAICVTVSGDPADMSTEEARRFVRQLNEVIGEAED